MSDHQTYDLNDVPPVTEEQDSAFALATTPAGWSVEGGAGGVMALNYLTLLEERKREAEDFAPSSVTVALRAVVTDEAGTYWLAPRGEVSDRPTYRNSRPGKLYKQEKGQSLLDSFFKGEDAFDRAPDDEVWKASLALAERYSLSRDALRNLNNAVALLILLRAGLSVSVERLPNVER